jgi:hypothetical protein
MTSAQAEANISLGDVALADCEAKRRLLIDAWPQPAGNAAQPAQPH